MKLVASIFIEAFCHATEDKDKVLSTILNLIPDPLRQEIKGNINVEALFGYYGNPIEVFRLKVSDREKAQDITSRIIGSLDDLDYQYLLDTLNIRTDGKGNLYLRVNKQSLLIEKVVIDDESDDIVKIKIKFLPHIRDEEDIRNALYHLRKHSDG